MTLVETLVILATIGAMEGACLVARNHALSANIVFALIDPIFVVHSLIKGDIQLFILFSVYQIISLYGVIYILMQQRKERLTRN